MDFAALFSEHFVVVVVLACLMLGYCIKTLLDFVPNKYIPTILAVSGALLNAFVGGWSVDNVVYGAFMGLSSTGLHQAFTRFIEHGSGTESGTDNSGV